MSDSPHPFTDHVTRSQRRNPKKYLWMTAAGGALLAAGFAFWVAGRVHEQEIGKLKSELAESTAANSRLQAEKSKAMEQIAALQLRVADLEKERDHAVQMHKGLEEEMRSELESKDVTISQLQGKLTVNILDRILFDSGEAVLRPAGEEVLQKIAGILKQHPELKIHVIGHTDNVPIRSTARARFASNWELSTARALAAVRFLTERAGVDPRRLGAVGYGEFRPVADNATPEGRARNRRIAVTILADELAGADIPASGSTNSLPALPPPGTTSNESPAPQNAAAAADGTP